MRIARWIWDIRPGGTYRFRSEGPGAMNSHEGTITLSKGVVGPIGSATELNWSVATQF
jgi:hypothetical protein